MEKDLKLIVMQGAKPLGEKVDSYLKKAFNTDNTFIVDTSNPRFNNGEAKALINESIRNDDVYILCDIGNHSIAYEMFHKISYMSPDEHFQDLKRFICACMGHANRISVIMPLLYESRQHRRKGRESLDCAMALQELERLGVKEIITFDAHDPNIQNAIPCSSFDSFYVTTNIIESMMKNDQNMFNNPDNYLVISPDVGAMDRARYYADMLGTDVGICYKRRDLSKIVNGKNPVVAHEYLGKDVSGKNLLIVDDMIASGGSILDCAKMMKERGAKNISLAATFSLFTEGKEKFEEYYNKGIISKVYSTNLTYLDEDIKNEPWFEEVDCSENISEIIYKLYLGQSISPLLNGKAKATELVRSLRKKN